MHLSDRFNQYLNEVDAVAEKTDCFMLDHTGNHANDGYGGKCWTYIIAYNHGVDIDNISRRGRG